jgi:electron transfer flavoprotein beta subunit
MTIYVCVKHVPDSAATITVMGENRIDEKITFLINPYDEHALTEAARIRQDDADSEVVAVCLGKPAAEATLRSAMAMGADRSILIETDRNHDSIFTARALAAAIRQDGRPWIVFTGKESIDSEGMQTHFRLATPCVLGAGKGLNTPKYPTFPDIMKARKKEVRRIGLDALNIAPPAAAMTVEALTAAEERRTPKELTGSAAQIAARIVDILKNEAKVT